MRNRQKHTTLLVLLIVLCLAGAAVLGVMAWRILSERRVGAQEHQEEAAYATAGMVTEDPAVTEEPIDMAEAPEAESLEDVSPEIIQQAEEAALSTSAVTAAPSTPTPEPTSAPEITASPTPTVSPTPVPQVGKAVSSAVHYTADFTQLEAVNPDVRGWLVQDGTDINYPIAQAEDNTYYLNHLFTGAVNKTGAVFMDCGSSRYFTDMCTWLYAHNRQDGSMFASVPSYMAQDYLDAHPDMYLLTPYEDYRVEIFACIRGSLQVEEEWRVRSFAGRSEFDAYIQRIRGQSAVKSAVDVSWGDQLLALCTCTNEVHDERYVVFGVLRPLVYEDEAGMAVTRLELDAQNTLTKTVTIPGKGDVLYYAQNDPVWYRMRYECRQSSQHRPFGQSGCGPTALAMAISSVATDDQLLRLNACSLNGNGFTFCTCSVNQYFCNRKHIQYKVRTAEEMRRYMPVVMASFATGNNLWGVQSRKVESGGTGSQFFPRVAEACNLDYTITQDIDKALDCLAQGGAAVFSTGGTISPFTGAGHYLTLIYADDEYFYILDPFYKDDYSQTDTRHVLEVLEPGVVRAKRSDQRYLLMYTFYLFTPKS